MTLMVDRISELPDGVLCHILSFLPTEEVVFTMLLSKRWKNLWLYVPDLYLNDAAYLTNEIDYSRFVEFVYAVIQARAGSQPIKTFHLSSWVSEPDNYLSYLVYKIWVNTAVNHGVEDLYLQMSFLMNLPLSVFSCKTLVFLELNKFFVNDFSSADLPSLKTLHLSLGGFLESRYLTELLNGCPILEVLHLESLFSDNDSYMVEMKTLPKLIRAVTCNMLKFRMSMKAFCNAEHLRLEKITLPVSFFPNLTHLELFCGDHGSSWYLVFEMLKHSPNLQLLEIHEGPDGFVDEVLPFLNLIPECLSSQLRTCTLRVNISVEDQLLFAKYIMQNSKFLQTIKICLIYPDQRFKMVEELSICPRSSATCELLID